MTMAGHQVVSSNLRVEEQEIDFRGHEDEVLAKEDEQQRPDLDIRRPPDVLFLQRFPEHRIAEHPRKQEDASRLTRRMMVEAYCGVCARDV